MSNAQHFPATWIKAIKIASFLLCLSLTTIALGQTHYTPAQARKHIGETASVCGRAVNTHVARSTIGTPTFIDLDRPFPHQIFAIVIWGNDRAKFGRPEITYRGKHICVTGKIIRHNGVSYITATDPSQIWQKR
ncbi:MAG TPA: hypothetical protein VN577_01820 [Terriglobales bacterium]|nr:hypothetical protein [Terriglobales bacterium]